MMTAQHMFVLRGLNDKRLPLDVMMYRILSKSEEANFFKFLFLNMGGHKLPTVCGCLFAQLADTHMAMQTLTYRQPGIQRRPGIDRRLT